MSYILNEISILLHQYQSDTNTSVGISTIDVWIDPPTSTVHIYLLTLWVRFFDLWCPLPDGDDLPKVQFVIVHLGDEDGCHGLIERRTIHVDGGPDRQHEADDASVDMVVLKEALEGDRQSSRAAGGKEK